MQVLHYLEACQIGLLPEVTDFCVLVKKIAAGILAKGGKVIHSQSFPSLKKTNEEIKAEIQQFLISIK